MTEVSRRGFLAVGGAGVMGLSLGEALSAHSGQDSAAIQIILTGGASQFETFDPKPHAPREIRGPLHSIATKIPGVRFSECLPQLAERADRLVVLRSLCHDAAPIHATGLQLLHTGSVFRRAQPQADIGWLVEELVSSRRKVPLVAHLGGRPDSTGTAAISGAQPADGSSNGTLPDFGSASTRTRAAYGESRFGRMFWQAARLIESGTRFVRVHSFSKLEGEPTWDAHGCSEVGPATVFDYRDSIGPQFDQALAALLDDLQQTGHWKHTLVTCTGEMGRSPRLNDNGGRDHWTQAWSGLMAGGMLPGGTVIGETDEHGENVLESPMNLGDLASLLLESLGIPAGSTVHCQDGRTLTTPTHSASFA